MIHAVRSIVLVATLALAGCASTNPKDPFEQYNRAMFRFNDAIDQAALKPAAEVYRDTLPSFVQTGVSNFFGNLGDVWTAVNDLLQGKFADGVTDVMRVAVNSTLGFGGVLDIGTEAGLTKHKEDFGQTLGKWGVIAGPYVVLPLLGPSTVRDTLATPVDLSGDLWSYVYPVRVRNPGYVVRVVDQRAGLLDASTLIEEAALDRYVFVRDAYLQRRESKIRDGESPRTSYEDEEDPTKTALDEGSGQKRAPNDAAPDTVQSFTEPGAKPVVELEQNAAAGSTTDIAVIEKKQ
jgi:phospholipid-binding lipoprotein MlaA